MADGAAFVVDADAGVVVAVRAAALAVSVAWAVAFLLRVAAAFLEIVDVASSSRVSAGNTFGSWAFCWMATS